MMMRRLLLRVVLGAFAGLMLPAAQALELVEGRNWRPVASAAQASDDPARIEVLEFFSYGCPHCGDLNPLIKEWAAALPSDVSFERVPVTFGRAAWEGLARLYFALDFAGELERLDQAVFDAITKQRTNLFTEKATLTWIEEQGVDPDSFAKFYNSFAVEAALARANTLAARFRVDAVPMIIVDGRYQVLNDGAKSKADLLEIADGLIEKARQAPQD
jgi:thiol:disulfide interchange protein DsbA